MNAKAVSNQAGTLYLVATPIGHLDDLTLRARRVLGEVDRILAEDTRHSRRLLAHHGIDTPLVPFHEHNEDRRQAQVIGWLEAGQSLALISDAGTPLINDPGFPLVRECRRRGIRVTPVPGPSAVLAALSASGLPTDRFCYQGFLPRQPVARRERLNALKDQPATLVFYESSHRIAAALADMVEVLGPDRPACVARELTKRHEEFLNGTLEELAALVAADPDRRRGEFVVVVGAPPEEKAAAAADEARVLEVLLEELPLKQAVSLAARILGGNRNQLYRRALARRGE